MPLVGRVLIALAVVAAVSNEMDAMDHRWQNRPVVLALQAADNADKPVTVLSMQVADLWSAGGPVTEERVKARWTPGNAYFEPVFFTLDVAARQLRPAAQDRCYYFPIHDASNANHERVSHVGQFCFRGSMRSPYATSLYAVVR
jgi:hypothetical protein